MTTPPSDGEASGGGPQQSGPGERRGADTGPMTGSTGSSTGTDAPGGPRTGPTTGPLTGDTGPRTGEPLPSAPLPPPPPPPGMPGAEAPPPPPPTAGRGIPGYRPFDIVAVFAMVFAVLFGPIGFVLAIISMFRTGSVRRGRGLAITALVVSILWIAVVAAAGFAVYSLTARRDSSGAISRAGDLSVYKLRAGDCIKKFGEGTSFTVDAVPCKEPHDTQVYALFDLPDKPFPGQAAVTADAERGCTERLPEAMNARVSSGEVSIGYYQPQEATWGRDREVACVFVSEKGEVTEQFPIAS
jgi:hypothetical protein